MARTMTMIRVMAAALRGSSQTCGSVPPASLKRRVLTPSAVASSTAMTRRGNADRGLTRNLSSPGPPQNTTCASASAQAADGFRA